MVPVLSQYSVRTLGHARKVLTVQYLYLLTHIAYAANNTRLSHLFYVPAYPYTP